jgi:hypothetical protein
MKKKLIIVLIFLLSLSMLTGCGLFNGKDDILSDVKPYRIINVHDRSLMSAKRIEVAVYVEDKKVSTDKLRKYTEDIVKKYKDDYKGVMVSFYDIMEETYEYSNIPMAVGVWSPKGNFDEALLYHKYTDNNYSIVLKRNKSVYTPTNEELQSYIEYIKLRDKTVEEKLEIMNIPEDKIAEFLKIIDKVKNRYEEVVKR